MSISTLAGSYLNSNYLVRLKNKSGSINIRAFLPEDFRFSLDSDWDNILKDYISGIRDTALQVTQKLASTAASALLGNWAGKTIDSAADLYRREKTNLENLTDSRSQFTQLSSFPSWKGNSPLKFSIPFIFEANTDANKDVYNNVRNLLKLVSPTIENGILKAPGPYLQFSKELINTDKTYTLSIGKLIYINDIIITGVDTDIESRFDINGKPMGATCTVQFQTIFPPTIEDIENWFGYNTEYTQTSQYSYVEVAQNLLKSYEVAKGKLTEEINSITATKEKENSAK